MCCHLLSPIERPGIVAGCTSVEPKPDAAGTTRLLAQFLCQSGGAGDNGEGPSMCDYSLQKVKSRPAKVGEKLRTQHFDTGTIGFAAPEDYTTAVCVLPGTELAWCSPRGLFGWKVVVLNHRTAIFRQINKHNPRTCVDAPTFKDAPRSVHSQFDDCPISM